MTQLVIGSQNRRTRPGRETIQDSGPYLLSPSSLHHPPPSPPFRFYSTPLTAVVYTGGRLHRNRDTLYVFFSANLYTTHHPQTPSVSCAMAIHPTLSPQSNAQGTLSPQQARAISAWSEQAAAHLGNLTISDSVPAADQHRAGPESPSTRGALRGTTVTLSIPLEDPVPSTGNTSAPRVKLLGQPSAQTQQVPSVSFRRREPLRRDSLKRREALLKGKDGSRRRQRWENGTS